MMFGFFKKKAKSRQQKQQKNEATHVSCVDEEVIDIPLMEVLPTDMQQALRGTKIRFSENYKYNLSLFARRLPTDSLKCERFNIGSLSQRAVVIVYLKNRANPGIVDEVKDRIKSIRTATVLDSSYIERNIEDSNISPFPQVEVTQRPDVAESALMQGRVAIVVDGCPDVLLAPTTFFDLMDTPDDAYLRWPAAATFFRVARLVMFFLAVSLPAFYIALTSFNPETIPTRLLILQIMAGREDTPFPIYFEAFFMMGVVEAIRMMMIRIPSQIGSTIAVVSGLTLVIAGLYSNTIGPIVVIVVTLTMIASFGVPNYDLKSAVRLIQFFTMIMATIFGIFGYAAAFFYIAIHLATLKSFGIPYMSPLAPTEGSGLRHTVYRSITETMPQDETYKPLNNVED